VIKQLDPSRGRIAFATLYASAKQYGQALAEFDEVLKTNPDDYTALYQVGRLATMTGQFVDRGVTSLRRCLELPAPTTPNTPGHAAANWRLGLLLEKKSDATGARAAYEAANRLDPKFTPATEALRKLAKNK
jgi:tetratricopeptide (TPR) repeat protein